MKKIMNLEAIKSKAGARELDIIDNPKMRISGADPRDSGPIGPRVDGLTYFYISIESPYPASYAGERAKHLEMCAWSSEHDCFVL